MGWDGMGWDGMGYPTTGDHVLDLNITCNFSDGKRNALFSPCVEGHRTPSKGGTRFTNCQAGAALNFFKGKKRKEQMLQSLLCFPRGFVLPSVSVCG